MQTWKSFAAFLGVAQQPMLYWFVLSDQKEVAVAIPIMMSLAWALVSWPIYVQNIRNRASEKE